MPITPFGHAWRRAYERLSIRDVVLSGFVAMFVLALVFSYHLDRRLIDVEQQGASIHAQYVESEGLLLTVAAQILLGTVDVRDALLDPTLDSVAHHRAQLENARAEIERALQQYLVTVSSAAERDRWTALRAELDEYWNAMLPTLGPDVARNPEEARAFLRERVVPRRRTILEIASQIRTLNRETYARSAEAVARLYRETRRDAWAVGGVAVLLGLVVALAATRTAGRLESRIREQRLQEAAHTHELERLSARLVRVQEEERRTIARDVHDEVGQALTAIKIELAVAQRTLEAGGRPIEGLQNVRAMTDSALHAVRDVARLLHPVMLETLGLSGTLRGYVQAFAERTGLRTDLTQHGELDGLGPEIEICVYRIVQEALTNVARHAHASVCQVDVVAGASMLRVSVEDDGVGIDEQEGGADRGSGGLGLIGVRERVLALRGTVRVSAVPGGGTRLLAEIPLPEGAREAAARALVEDGVLVGLDRQVG